jgi:hypothetical protein
VFFYCPSVCGSSTLLVMGSIILLSAPKFWCCKLSMSFRFGKLFSRNLCIHWSCV